MPRLPRIGLDGAIYYVISRASQNEVIFKDKEDYKMYLDLVNKYKSQHKFKLYSYCLLPDRLELLIETGDDQAAGQGVASISEIMHDLNSLYTKYYNGRYQRHGHLFESRFRSVLVEKVNYLLAVTRHIHRAAPSVDYPYSSFQVYVAQPGSSEETKEVLSFLRDIVPPAEGGSASGGKAYERYVMEGDKKEIKELEKRLGRGSVLGSDSFHVQVTKKVEEHTRLQKEASAKRPANTLTLYFIGGLVIVASSAAVYLYSSNQKLQTQYEILLRQKEAEFTERTKFENISPIALTELDGTRWQIEAVSLPAGKAKGTVPDALHFSAGKFYSEVYSRKGFGPAQISTVRLPNGLTSWEAHQSTANGDTLGWRGSWQGDVMKGVVSFTPAGEKTQNFSFFSTGWAYEPKGETQ